MSRSGLIAVKLGNSSFFNDNGSITHVTLLKVEDCVVSKVKTMDKDGYNAIQLASIDLDKDIKIVWESSRWSWAPIFARAIRLTGKKKYIDGLESFSKSSLSESVSKGTLILLK